MARIFNHYVPTNLLLMVALEALVLTASIYIGVSIRFIDQHLVALRAVHPVLPSSMTFAALMLLLMTTFGLYRQEYWDSPLRPLARVAGAFLLGFAIMSLLFYIIPGLYLGRGAFGIGVLIAFIGISVNRLLFYHWTDFGMLLPRILVVGTGSRALNVETLADSGPYKAKVVAYLPVKGGQHFVDPEKILPENTSLIDAVDQYGVNEIVLAVRERRGGVLPLQDLLECKLRGVRVTEISSFLEREQRQVRLDSLNASWLILGEGFNNRAGRDSVKRVFDLTASLILLLLTLPVMLVAAVAIRMDSGGPVLYRQERVGQGGRTFHIYKFRSMRTDAEGDGTPRWAGGTDDRVTRVGRIIRKLRIDELPQILNVLKGEMSFVGPRPERPFFVEQLARQIPYYAARHSIKPGITGWAQVRYPYGASVQDAVEKLQYDLYYVKNHSLFLDIMILIDTVQVVVWGQGAR